MLVLSLNSGMSHSYSTQSDKNLSKYAMNNRRFDERNESTSALANQVCMRGKWIIVNRSFLGYAITFILFSYKILLQSHFNFFSSIFPLLGVLTQLSEQISSLNERMDVFATRIEELNSKFTFKQGTSIQQIMAFQADACNGSTPLPTLCWV